MGAPPLWRKWPRISTKMLPKDSLTLDWSVGLTARARELGSQQKLPSSSQPSLSPQLPSTPLVLPLLFSPWLYSLQRPLLERCSTKENEEPMMAFLWVGGLQSARSWGGRPSLCASGLPTLAQWHLLRARARGEGARGPAASPEDRSLCVRRKLMASRMMEALSRWELTL